jgi:hypothetical protein
MATGWTVRGSNAVGARFLAHVQIGSGAHPASCTMGTGLSRGVKRPGRGADHPSTSSAEVKERVELYFYSPSGPSGPVLSRANFTFYNEQEATTRVNQWLIFCHCTRFPINVHYV